MTYGRQGASPGVAAISASLARAGSERAPVLRMMEAPLRANNSETSSPREFKP